MPNNLYWQVQIVDSDLRRHIESLVCKEIAPKDVLKANEPIADTK